MAGGDPEIGPIQPGRVNSDQHLRRAGAWIRDGLDGNSG
jgi:hypothetical protein